MGGPGAPGEWLATSDDPEAMASEQYFYHQKRHDPEPAARDEEIQERADCEVRKNFWSAGV